MMDAMRPAPEAVRPRGHEAADEASEATRVGQNEPGPREAGEATAGGRAEAALPVAPVAPAPVGQPAAGPAPLYKASAGASRIAAKGERAKAEAEAEAIRLKAETEQKLAERGASEAARKAKEAAKLASKEARRKAMREAVGRTTGAVGRGLAHMRDNADGSFSMGIYLATVTVAASSQAWVAHDRFEWSWPRAVGGALFIEGLSLAFALTAHKLRMKGEKAWAARLLTAAAAGFGAYVNYEANYNFPGIDAQWSHVMAVVLAASSIASIVLWEMRTSAASRDKLRKAEKKSEPKATLGLDLLLRFPGTWFWAWSAMVFNPKVRTREAAVRVGLEMRAARRERLAQEAARREAIKVEATIREVAKRAALKAAKKGEAGPALTALAHLAHSGTAALVGQPALEAGPSASKAGLTIEGALVAKGAGPRPPAPHAPPRPPGPLGPRPPTHRRRGRPRPRGPQAHRPGGRPPAPGPRGRPHARWDRWPPG